MHRRQQRFGLSALRPGVRLGLAALLATLVLAGCGGDPDPEPAVNPAPDRSARISQLQKRKDQLEKRLAAQEKKEMTEAEARTAESGGEVAVNRMLTRLPGEAGLVAGAPGAGGPDLSGGGFSTGDAWSTIKVPIAERVLKDFGGPNGIGSTRSANITNAITLSDNDAAAALFADLEKKHGGLAPASEAVGEMLRQAGDGETVILTEGRDSFSTYGQTDWSLASQFRYMAALAGGCIGDSASRTFLLGQMAAVGGSDVFGIGAAGFPARWKGGWGPEPDGRYLVRQMGVMEVDGKEIVLAMAAIPDDGTFESGQSMLSQIARWTAAHLADRITAPAGC